jgi:hypothetical protein
MSSASNVRSRVLRIFSVVVDQRAELPPFERVFLALAKIRRSAYHNTRCEQLSPERSSGCSASLRSESASERLQNCPSLTFKLVIVDLNGMCAEDLS